VWLAIGCALRQNCGMSFTAGVGSAGEVFASVLVDFQIVGDVFAVQAITKNQSIRWMVEAKVFHEIHNVVEKQGNMIFAFYKHGLFNELHSAWSRLLDSQFAPGNRH